MIGEDDDIQLFHWLRAYDSYRFGFLNIIHVSKKVESKIQECIDYVPKRKLTSLEKHLRNE